LPSALADGSFRKRLGFSQTVKNEIPYRFSTNLAKAIRNYFYRNFAKAKQQNPLPVS
jgi:hypothetical protein